MKCQLGGLEEEARERNTGRDCNTAGEAGGTPPVKTQDLPQ